MPKPSGPPKKEDFGAKVKVHQRYYVDGRMVPGVTTVLGVLAKPYLVGWANRLGLDGIDSRKYTDEAASVGSCAHEMIEADLSGREAELDDFSANQIERARLAFAQYRLWRDENPFEPTLAEAPLVSAKHGYGGKIDSYGIVRQIRRALVDFKTSNGIYDEHKTQISAYAALLTENGRPVDDVYLVRVPRAAGETFEVHKLGRTEIRARWRLFLAALEVHKAQKELKSK